MAPGKELLTSIPSSSRQSETLGVTAGPTCTCGVDALHCYLTPGSWSRPAVQHPETRPQDVMLLIHLQELEGAAAAVTLHLCGLHKRILYMPHQPLVLSARPALVVTHGCVQPPNLKGNAYQLRIPEMVRKELAGGHYTERQAGGLGSTYFFSLHMYVRYACMCISMCVHMCMRVYRDPK